MKIRISLICLSCLYLLSTCKSQEESISPLEKFKEIQNQIGQTWIDYVTYFERREIDSIMICFTEKCVIMPDFGFTINGKEELKEMFVEFFENNTAAITDHVTTELMVHRDDIFEVGELEQLIVSNDGDTVEARSRYILLFQRQDDKGWKIHRWFIQPEKKRFNSELDIFNLV